MAWFKREKKPIDQPTPPDERRVKTEGLWIKCEACRAIVWKKDLEANWNVCPKCQFHFKLNATKRLDVLLDGVRIHRRLDGRGGRRKGDPRDRAGACFAPAAGDCLQLGRRAHDGGHHQPDAARKSFRGAGAPG